MVITLSRDEWNDFVYGLNHPTQENIEAKERLFAECDKLIVTWTDEGCLVETDEIDEEAILDILGDAKI